MPAPQPDGTTSGQQSHSNAPYNIAALMNIPLTLGKDKHVTATLTPEQLENVSNARCLVMVEVDRGNSAFGIEDDALIFLGNDTDVKIDWKSRTFTDNFRAVWPMFNGHVLFLQTDFVTDEYIFYNVPVICNGETIKGVVKLTAGTTFKVGKNPTITDENVSNGKYGYCFRFFAPDGNPDNFAISQPVSFTVENGKIIKAELVPVETVDNVTVK